MTPVKSEDQNKSAIKKRVSICLENLPESRLNKDVAADELLLVDSSEPRVSLSLAFEWPYLFL